MTAEDLSFVADALLALCEKEADAPFYTDKGFAVKLRTERMREAPAASLFRGDAGDGLLESEWRDAFRLAKLTPRQSEVLALRLEGHTFEAIGAAGGHSKQGAQSIFVAALKKITRSFSVYPYKGLADVYRQEVRRGRPSRPGRSGFGTMSAEGERERFR